MRWTLAALAILLAACTSAPAPSPEPQPTPTVVTATATPAATSTPSEPSPSPVAFHFDVQNRSSVNVVVSVVSDMAAWMPGFTPGQRGTIVIDLGTPTNGIGIEIQDGKCGLLAKKDYPTPTPFTLIIEDADTPGAVRLSTVPGSAPSPIPLPSNSVEGCGG